MRYEKWMIAAFVIAAPAVARAQGDAPAPGQTAPAPLVARVVVLGARGVQTPVVENAVRAVTLGKPGDGETLRAAARAVAALYRARGFSVAQVVNSDVSADGQLTVTVAEGTIRRVLVRGNGKTLGSVIRTAVDLKPGDTYRDGAVKNARNRLARLGIFDEIVIVGALEGSEEAKRAEKPDVRKEKGEKKGKFGKPDTPADDDLADVLPKKDDTAPTPAETVADEVGFVDLIIRVKERRTGNIAATFGYNEGTGLVGFLDFSEQNVAGTANRAAIAWQRTNTGRFDSNGNFVDNRTRSAYSVAYDAPALGPRSTAIGGAVYDTNTVFSPYFSSTRDNLRNYELRKGGQARVGRAVGRSGTLYLTGRRDKVGYDLIPDALNPPLAELANADATVMAFGTELVLDGRDDINSPRRGYLSSLSYERATRLFGGTRAYNALSADLRSYAPLGKPTNSPVFALRLLAGAVGDNAPLSEEFWLGGYNTLRGYDLYSIRGTRELVGSGEFRLPLGNGFAAALFADIGNAYLPGQRVSLTNLKAGVGAGLRFATPIGPIRLDVAYGNRVQTYVSLGQSY